jgi:sugar phosphate isomerase/epimerase
MTQPTRRNVLKSTVAAGAATTIGAFTMPSHANAMTTNATGYQHSICSWCFTGSGPKWTMEQLCEIAPQVGCSSIELVGPDTFPLLKKHKLTCAITSTGLSFQIGFNNLVHREELMAKTKKAIDVTKEAGFPSVIAFVGMKWNNPKDPKSGEISKDDAFKNCVAGLKDLATYAEKANVNVCVEHLNSRDGTTNMSGHPGYQGDDLDFVTSILKAVGSSRIKLLFDIYHVQIMHGDLIRRLEECKEWIGHIHTAGVPGRHELDENQEIYYPAVTKKLNAIGYKGFVGHEYIPTQNDAIAGLKQAVKACSA